MAEPWCPAGRLRMRRLIAVAQQVHALVGDEHGHTYPGVVLATFPMVLGAAGVAWALTLPLPFSVLVGVGAIAFGIGGCALVILRRPAPSIGVRMFSDGRVEQLGPTADSPYNVVWLGRRGELALY